MPGGEVTRYTSLVAIYQEGSSKVTKQQILDKSEMLLIDCLVVAAIKVTVSSTM